MYVPPDQRWDDRTFQEVYRGKDGSVLRNPAALPRYFFVTTFGIDPSPTPETLSSITDFRRTAIIERLPQGTPYVESPKGGEVTVERYSSNAALLRIRSEGWNLLATSEVFWKGWTASWNGIPLDVSRINGAFVGVFVPPGSGKLELRYVAPGFWRGVLLSGAGWSCLFGIAIWGAFMRRRPNRAE